MRRFADELIAYCGPPPREPGQAGAIAYHRRMVAALKAWPRGFDPPLRRRLMRRERKWRARANGTDRRWAVLGARSGRTPAWLQAELTPQHPAYAAPVTNEDL